MGGNGNLKLGQRGGKGEGTGGKGNRCEWIKCLPESTLPKPTFRLGQLGGKAKARGTVAPVTPLAPPMESNSSAVAEKRRKHQIMGRILRQLITMVCEIAAGNHRPICSSGHKAS